jgi:hypothetical protein
MSVSTAGRHRRLALAGLVALSVTVAAGSAAAPAGAVKRPRAGATAAVAASFNNYPAPGGLGTDAGEPSIGADWATGNTMYQAGLQTLRVDFSTSPPSWRDVSSTITSTTSLDPILFTDSATNRTLVSQLSAGCSLMAYSDDDGASWFQNPIGCGIASGADHQTVGGGPFPAGAVGPLTGYKDAVYYCAQAIVTAQCALSQDGGTTFNPAVPIYNATQCNGLHGHVKVAPDGTAYVPNADCGGKQGVAYSTDSGTTWKLSTVPDSSTQDESDPSVGVGAGNTAYLGYANNTAGGNESHPMISIRRPGSTGWTPSVDVGAALGIKNVQFPAVVAGDDDRAAFAFLGTTTAGDDQAASFPGVWHLYVATTIDGGTSWTTTDATPSDPVQRGCIWLGGGSNTCRNLLDFNDATIDSTGRVLVGYADGCTGTCVSGGTNTHSALATIARQVAGDDLIAAR